MFRPLAKSPNGLATMHYILNNHDSRERSVNAKKNKQRITKKSYIYNRGGYLDEVTILNVIFEDPIGEEHSGNTSEEEVDLMFKPNLQELKDVMAENKLESLSEALSRPVTPNDEEVKNYNASFELGAEGGGTPYAYDEGDGSYVVMKHVATPFPAYKKKDGEKANDDEENDDSDENSGGEYDTGENEECAEESPVDSQEVQTAINDSIYRGGMVSPLPDSDDSSKQGPSTEDASYVSFKNDDILLEEPMLSSAAEPSTSCDELAAGSSKPDSAQDNLQAKNLTAGSTVPKKLTQAEKDEIIRSINPIEVHVIIDGVFVRNDLVDLYNLVPERVPKAETKNTKVTPKPKSEDLDRIDVIPQVPSPPALVRKDIGAGLLQKPSGVIPNNIKQNTQESDGSEDWKEKFLLVNDQLTKYKLENLQVKLDTLYDLTKQRINNQNDTMVIFREWLKTINDNRNTNCDLRREAFNSFKTTNKINKRMEHCITTEDLLTTEESYPQNLKLSHDNIQSKKFNDFEEELSKIKEDLSTLKTFLKDGVDKVAKIVKVTENVSAHMNASSNGTKLKGTKGNLQKDQKKNKNKKLTPEKKKVSQLKLSIIAKTKPKVVSRIRNVKETSNIKHNKNQEKLLVNVPVLEETVVFDPHNTALPNEPVDINSTKDQSTVEEDNAQNTSIKNFSTSQIKPEGNPSQIITPCSNHFYDITSTKPNSTYCQQENNQKIEAGNDCQAKIISNTETFTNRNLSYEDKSVDDVKTSLSNCSSIQKELMDKEKQDTSFQDHINLNVHLASAHGNSFSCAQNKSEENSTEKTHISENITFDNSEAKTQFQETVNTNSDSSFNIKSSVENLDNSQLTSEEQSKERIEPEKRFSKTLALLQKLFPKKGTNLKPKSPTNEMCEKLELEVFTSNSSKLDKSDITKHNVEVEQEDRCIPISEKDCIKQTAILSNVPNINDNVEDKEIASNIIDRNSFVNTDGLARTVDKTGQENKKQKYQAKAKIVSSVYQETQTAEIAKKPHGQNNYDKHEIYKDTRNDKRDYTGPPFDERKVSEECFDIKKSQNDSNMTVGNDLAVNKPNNIENPSVNKNNSANPCSKQKKNLIDETCTAQDFIAGHAVMKNPEHKLENNEILLSKSNIMRENIHDESNKKVSNNDQIILVKSYRDYPKPKYFENNLKSSNMASHLSSVSNNEAIQRKYISAQAYFTREERPVDRNREEVTLRNFAKEEQQTLENRRRKTADMDSKVSKINTNQENLRNSAPNRYHEYPIPKNVLTHSRYDKNGDLFTLRTTSTVKNHNYESTNEPKKDYKTKAKPQSDEIQNMVAENVNYSRNDILGHGSNVASINSLSANKNIEVSKSSYDYGTTNNSRCSAKGDQIEGRYSRRMAAENKPICDLLEPQFEGKAGSVKPNTINVPVLKPNQLTEDQSTGPVVESLLGRFKNLSVASSTKKTPENAPSGSQMNPPEPRLYTYKQMVEDVERAIKESRKQRKQAEMKARKQSGRPKRQSCSEPKGKHDLKKDDDDDSEFMV